MESFIAMAGLLTLAATIVDFIPVANVVTDLVGAVMGVEDPPTWWSFGLKMAETITVLQLLMPAFERFTARTANTWDDGVAAKAKMILAFAVEIVAAVGAVDPQIASRIAAITGPRRTRK